MATTYIIDPLSIATQGLITGNDIPGLPLTISTLGWIVIEEEIVPVRPPDVPVGGGLLSGPGPGIKDGRKISDLDDFLKKKITVKVMYKGRLYQDSVTLDDLTVTAKDVSVRIDEDDLSENVKVKILAYSAALLVSYAQPGSNDYSSFISSEAAEVDS